MSDTTMTPIQKSEEFGINNNLFMTFRYTDSQQLPISFGYIISQKAFYTFVGSNQPAGTRLVEEDVEFPDYLMNGSTRRALVHYLPGDKKFAAYVPVFPTEDEVEKYSMGFNRKSK